MYWIEAVILIKVAIYRAPLAYVVVMMAEALGSESGHAKAKVRHLADIYGEVIWIVVVNYLGEHINRHAEVALLCMEIIIAQSKREGCDI